MKARTRLLVTSGSVLVATTLVSPPALFALMATDPEWAAFWSAAAQPYATVLVGIGAILAASLAFYNGERERRQRADLEADKANREVRRELNDRYLQLLTQLSDSKPIIREGAVHGLVALAESWLTFGDNEQHRVCVAMLATYVRSPMEAAGPSCPDVPVRTTIMRLISELAERRGIKHYWGELNLQGADLRYVSLSQLRLRHFWLESALLSGADLGDTDLTGANLTSANIDDCDLRATNFTSAILQLTSAKRTNLRRTNFTKAALFGTDLQEAYIIRPWPKDQRAVRRGYDFITQAPVFQEAYLIGANLTNADLSGAHMQGSKLDWADFTDASLYFANLMNATVEGTIVQGADLTRTNLSGIKPSGDVLRSNRKRPRLPESFSEHRPMWTPRD